MDASSPDKRIVNGYNICEAIVLTKNESQPVSIYSKIYSCKSDNFESKNTYTLESIKAAEKVCGEDFTGVFDLGYDDNKIFTYMTKNNHKFVVRLDDARTLLNAQGNPEEAISICRIASIRITSSTYNDNITYLPAPSPLPTGCDANCEAAARAYLPVGTTAVNINAGGQTVAQGTILKSEYGMVVVVGNNNSDPTFVSLCKAEIINK